MFDPLLELEIILGVLFWLGAHQLVPYGWRWHQRQRGLPRRRPKGKYPPIPGLIKQPHCEHCAGVSDVHAAAPLAPPVMSSRRGRPRQVNTAAHYCPNTACAYYGWLKRGNIRANGRPNARTWRQLHGRACGRYFLETHGTLFFGKQHAPITILYAISYLAEGVGLRATARIFSVEPNTVLSWLMDAAHPSTAVSSYLLHDLKVTQNSMSCLPWWLNGALSPRLKPKLSRHWNAHWRCFRRTLTFAYPMPAYRQPDSRQHRR